MKTEFKNRRLDTKNLVEEFGKFEKVLMEDIGAYYTEQSKANAPMLDGEDVLADSIGMTEFDGEKVTIFSDHPASLKIHEEPEGVAKLNPKSQSSDTGGLGNKFMTRAVYLSSTIVKKHVNNSLKDFFSGKTYKKLAAGDVSSYIKTREEA